MKIFKLNPTPTPTPSDIENNDVVTIFNVSGACCAGCIRVTASGGNSSLSLCLANNADGEDDCEACTGDSGSYSYASSFCFFTRMSSLSH